MFTTVIMTQNTITIPWLSQKNIIFTLSAFLFSPLDSNIHSSSPASFISLHHRSPTNFFPVKFFVTQKSRLTNSESVINKARYWWRAKVRKQYLSKREFTWWCRKLWRQKSKYTFSGWRSLRFGRCGQSVWALEQYFFLYRKVRDQCQAIFKNFPLKIYIKILEFYFICVCLWIDQTRKTMCLLH